MGRKEITTKEDLMKVIELFENTGITYWLDGGWGVDILAGKQTRIHRDIDINFDAQHTEKLLNVLLNLGYKIDTDWKPVRIELYSDELGYLDIHPFVLSEDGTSKQADLEGGWYEFEKDYFGSAFFEGKTLALGSALLVGVVAGCSSSVNIPSDNNTTKNVSYQAQTVSDTENAANDSTTAELPGGSVDYSIYEPYGLSYDQENYYFTYNGNVVRFFNDPIAGASFTNFFSGTVDIEADRDEENNLVGIKECSKENYDRHTQKHNNFNPTDTSLSTVQKGESTPQLWLKDYADYGITYNEQSGGWYYNNQRIKILLDSEQAVVYTDEENGVCVTISRDGNHQISEIKEISETDAQSLMLKNNPIGEDYTSQE